MFYQLIYKYMTEDLSNISWPKYHRDSKVGQRDGKEPPSNHQEHPSNNIATHWQPPTTLLHHCTGNKDLHDNYQKMKSMDRSSKEVKTQMYEQYWGHVYTHLSQSKTVFRSTGLVWITSSEYITNLSGLIERENANLRGAPAWPQWTWPMFTSSSSKAADFPVSLASSSPLASHGDHKNPAAVIKMFLFHHRPQTKN